MSCDSSKLSIDEFLVGGSINFALGAPSSFDPPQISKSINAMIFRLQKALESTPIFDLNFLLPYFLFLHLDFKKNFNHQQTGL